MKHTYDKMTSDDFDQILDKIVDGMTAGQILSIDGVRELVQEELNNEVLEKWQKDNPKLAEDWSEEKTKIDRMTRDEIVDVLESHSILCYDNEDKECLATALLENVKDGTIELTA